MISELDRQNFVLNYYINKGELDKAEEIILKNPALSDNLRLIGIRYADFDDYENSLRVLDKAYLNGDNKSLPWLVELLKSGESNPEKLELLQQKLDYLIKIDDMEVIFSLGNLYSMQGDSKKQLEIWKNFINKNIWIFDRNIIGLIFKSPLDEDALKYLNITGPDEYEIFNYAIRVLSFHSDKEALAASMFLNSFFDFGNLPPYSQIDKMKLLNRCDQYAKNGDIESILRLFEISRTDSDLDHDRYKQLITENNLEEIAALVGLDLTDTTSAKASLPGKSLFGLNKDQKQIDEIFEKAQFANQKGDFKTEIAAWVEGAKLGNADCFYNIGVTVGNELGITCNFFGCNGGSDTGWSVVAKGIQMNDTKPMQDEINYINEELGSSVISTFRKKYNLPELGVKDNQLNPPKEIIDKFLNYIEYSDFRLVKLGDNLYCLPYIDNNQTILIFAEIIKNDDDYLLMIYASALVSNEENEINDFEKKILKILVRDSYIVFPNTGISLGDIFSSIPADQMPNLFFNQSKSRELWTMIGPTIEEIIIEPIPAKQEFTNFQFGVAIDVTLQSDHYQTAIANSFQTVFSTVSNLYSLYAESEEKFDLFFDQRSIYLKEILEIDRSTEIYEQTAHRSLDSAIDKLVKFGETDTYFKAKKSFGLFTNRLVANAEFNEKNIEFIGTELLEASRHFDLDIDLRGSLNNVGWFYLLNFENFGKARVYLEESARLGCANALSALTWNLMLGGKFQEAINLFERHYYKIMTTRDSELDFDQAANMRSNYAVNLWALGKDVAEINMIWQDEYLQGDHAESMFYPILIEYMSGDSNKAISDVKALPSYARDQLRSDFSEDFSNSPWFKNIATKSLELLAKAN
jgi:hypothetical protein